MSGQERPEPVYIKGRFGERTSGVIFALFLGPVLLGASELGRAANNWICVPGWGGYSAGSEIHWALFVFYELMFLILGGWALVSGWRMCKRRRNLPLGYRPWFRQRLIEGQAAVRLGTLTMGIGTIVILVWCGIFLPWDFKDFRRYPLVPPAAMAQCQALHPVKADTAQSAQPAAGK